MPASLLDPRKSLFPGRSRHLCPSCRVLTLPPELHDPVQRALGKSFAPLSQGRGAPVCDPRFMSCCGDPSCSPGGEWRGADSQWV